MILVVDDTADTCEIYSLYLTSRGFKVPTARDGLSGIEAAERLHPDVVVMDLSMPDLDGIEATRRLKADPRTSDIPVLILTAHPMLAVQRGALEGGADGFLTKPCLPEDLEKYLRQFLDRTPAT
jgi:two-component system, cell cycle response regulator DivK